jgi:hypothetical protein
MKLCYLIVAAFFFLTSLIYAQKTTADSAAAAVGGKATAIDGDLILDDIDNTILPAEKPKNPVPPHETAKTTDTPSVTETAGAPLPSGIQTPAPKITDEELILEGGEESLLGKERKLQPEDAAPSTATASLPDTAPSAETAEHQPADSPLPGPGAFADSAVRAASPSLSPAPAVEDVHAINFARNLKEYRSPKLAMLMSLILPGSGQVYAKANLWAAAFGVVEAAVIGTGLALSAKSKRIKKDAHAFADKHYDTGSFSGYTNDLRIYLQSLSDSTSYASIFLDGGDTALLAEARKKSDVYYDYINRGVSSPFIRGWDDVRPSFSSSGFDSITQSDPEFGIVTDTSYLLFLKPDSTNRLFGVSANQEHYNDILRDSRDWAGYARNTFLSLLINHVASSVMAGIAAKKHNDELLGRESLWQRINLEQRYVFTGSETAPGYSLQVAF